MVDGEKLTGENNYTVRRVGNVCLKPETWNGLFCCV